jgi:hypothetical protein
MKAKMRPKFTRIIRTYQDESKNEPNNIQEEPTIYQDSTNLLGWTKIYH